jgi:myo-inositol-1(or 4)-monophosphatase
MTPIVRAGPPFCKPRLGGIPLARSGNPRQADRMSSSDAFLATALDAARQAGALLRANFGGVLGVNELKQYDIKLELDVRSQELITAIILRSFPDHAIYGEEGLGGNQASDHQWIVDPIDGTVNYFYGIPHFCVSIALRVAGEIILGVIYDPMQDEMFVGRKGHAPELNGQPMQVSGRRELSDAMITVGFSKNRESIDAGLQRFKELLFKVRKTRMLGSAALGMAYVAAGRLDAYLEEVISLWDVAAGIILVETAGGRARLFEKDAAAEKYSMCCTNGHLPLAWVEEEMAGSKANA